MNLSWLLFRTKGKPKVENYNVKRKLVDEILNNNELNNELQNDIYTDGTALKKLLELDNYTSDSEEYINLYDDVIQVGEYKNI